jgi:hypothetical protein
MQDGPSRFSGRTVLRRAVALVRCEAIAGMLAVERFHHLVALGFCDDRGGGDREIDAVPFVEHVLRNFDARIVRASTSTCCGRRGNASMARRIASSPA